MTIKYPSSSLLPKFFNRKSKMTITDKIIAYEDDSMDNNDVIPFFQELIDTGLAWRLQGHYGRTAKTMLRAGLCKINKKK